jgi:hypothetical protein
MDAVSKFIVSNPLHPDVFPGKTDLIRCSSSYLMLIIFAVTGVRKMESEVVSMCLALSVLVHDFLQPILAILKPTF